MHPNLRIIEPMAIAGVVLVNLLAIARADDSTPSSEARQRPRWTESRVVGFPDPPPPFQVRKSFPNVELPKPLSVTRLPGTDDLLVTVHQGGYAGPSRLLRISNDETLSNQEEFLRTDEIIYGVAFHPDFAKNGYMYIGCNGDSEKLGKKATRVLRFHISPEAPNHCDASSKTVIIEWPSNGHNGGDLVFGHDRMLYVSAGDGTSDSDGNLAGQDLTTIPGSMIRIDVDHPAGDKLYSVPADNPFVDVQDARPEIWAYGLRNPWRICIDAKTGQIWAGNNGQDQWETVQVIRRGENYGWSITEGSHPFQLNRQRGPTPIVPPTIEHPHSEARSLTGGHVYYGSKYPALYGHYIYGDYSTGMIWAAKYDGQTVVSHFLVARTTLQISGFGIDHAGELLIVDYSSGLYRLEPNTSASSSDFPKLLSETGLFKSVRDHEMAAGIIPYQVIAPLWSDGAEKSRYIGLPGDSKIGFRKSGSWDFPNGTVLVKTFSLPLAEHAPGQLTRIETRLMTRHNGEWYGYSYQWNQEQTDAVLVSAAGKHVEFQLADPTSSQGTRQQSWYYPSRSDCMVCHSRAANYVLGLSALQTNRLISHADKDVSQLEYLHSLGVFQSAHDQGPPMAANVIDAKKVFEHPGSSDSLPKLVDPHDSSANVETRVRSYLHTNCAHCHVREGGGNSRFSVAFDAPLEKTGLIGELPAHDSFGISDARLIAPGDPQRSLLLHRLHHRGRGQMPPLASSVVDQSAVKLIAEWIASLKDTPKPENDASQ